ncbi:MAG: Sua5/YciO/YrdC/YwlC family protein [Cocleimonas sp.]
MQYTQNPRDIIEHFKSGNVFAYPTEAVFGLGCDPDNKEAVNQLLSIKKRSVKKGLILIASDFSQVQKYLKPLSEKQRQFTQASATTYIYPALDTAPAWLTGDFNSLAVRITTHPLARELCNILGSAIISTSANISGKDPARTVEEISIQFGHKISMILQGELGKSQKPSTIRDSISGEILRT